MLRKITKQLILFPLVMALALLYGFTPKAGADDWLQPADWGDTAHVFKRNVVTPGSPPNCRFELDDFQVPADTYEITGISFWMNKAYGCSFPTYFMYDDNGNPGNWFATSSGGFTITSEGNDPNGNPVCRYDCNFSNPVDVTPGDIYWIALSSPPCPGHYDWGLHNTPLLNGWGSNAKWCPEGTGLTPTPPYTNLDYPAGHTWYGQQVDVAFEIRFAGPAEPLDADFSGSPLTGVAPHNVDFTSEVTGGVEPYDYAWDLDGDGEFDDAFVANPIYIYVDLGRYDVSLRVTDSQLEEVTVTKERYIQVNEAGTQSGCISNANPDTVWFLFGDTVTESCTFANGMDRPTGQTGHGLIVGADDITIDGAGYCLDGVVKNCIAGEDNDAGIYSVAHSEVTINDLEIKNFCHGIYLAGDPGSGVPADGCIVECCDIHDNGVNESEVRTGGIWQNNVFNSLIKNCKVYNNEGDPTASSPPGGFGIYLAHGDNNEWSGNEVYENRKAGMFFRGMPKGTWVHHNYAHDNNFGGIRGMCMNTEGSLVEYNYCSDDNVGPGIMFGGPGGQDAEPNIARYNICRENETYGIEFSRAIINDKGECYENTACGNLGGYDIYVKPGVTIPGNCNTCDTTHNYTDASATSGCLYACGEEPDANFYARQSQDMPGPPFTVLFRDYSTPGSDPDAQLDYWYWDFGDCSDPVISDHSIDPIHDYAEPGTYTVCLTVTDDAGCPGDSEGRRDTLCLEVNVVEESDGYVLNYNAYPFETWLDPNWSGPAVMRMLIDHYRNDPWVPTQEELDVMGRDRNQSPCNDGLLYVDPLGMKLTLNDPDILHNNIHGRYANYGIGNFNADDLEAALHYICWYQYAGPGAAPTGGDYSHWMAIRGIHTSEDPHTAGGEYDVYGFWINDPAPGGIGENSYKTIEQWTGDPCYYQNLIGVRDCDDYYERYVAVCEPPDQPDAKVRLIPSPARFNRPITTMEKAVMVDALGDQMLVEGLEDEDALDVVKAAIDGVTEQLIPYDPQFAEIFAKTVAGEPLPVNDGNGDYYLVPFNLPAVKPGEAIEIQKLNEEDLEVVQVIEGKVVAELIPIDTIKVNEKNTLVVVLVDAEEGSFKETSWVDDPMKYLPVSKEEALKLVLADVGTSETKPMIELVNIDNSPYYPAWKITIDKKVFYISQDGTVSM